MAHTIAINLHLTPEVAKYLADVIEEGNDPLGLHNPIPVEVADLLMRELRDAAESPESSVSRFVTAAATSGAA